MEARKPSPAERQQVRLELPCDPQWASLLRLTVSGLAVFFDLSTAAIDDLKLTVTEAYGNALATSPAATRVEFAFDVGRDSITIDVETNAPRVTSQRDEIDVSLFVLRALVDDVAVGGADRYHLTLAKALD